MSMVLPPPLLFGKGGPVLNNSHTIAPPHKSPGTISRTAVQQQLLDNLTAELDRQASQRRTYRLPRDVVDVGTRPETDDMEWILTQKLKLHKVTANLRKKANSPPERAAVAKFDRHVNSIATEFRSRYAIELLRQSHHHKTSADRRVIQARYSTKPPLFAGANMPNRNPVRAFTSLPLGGVSTQPANATVRRWHWSPPASTDQKPNAPPRFGNAMPAGGSGQHSATWDKVIRPAGPCISRVKTTTAGPSGGAFSSAWFGSHPDVNMSRSASNRSTQASLTMSRTASNNFDRQEADVSLVDNCDALGAVDDDSEVPHYVQDLIDDTLDYDAYDGASSDVTSERELMEVDQEADHYASTVPAPSAPFNRPQGETIPPHEPAATVPLSEEAVLALYRTTVPVTEPHVRAMCYWFAIHVVGRLAFPEPIRPGANGSSAEEWDMGGVIDRSAKRMSGAGNFESEWLSSPRPPTPAHPYRVHGKIPSDPFKVLDVHGPGPIIKPDPQFVSFLVHLVYEKEIAIETIIAAAWFIDGLSVHDVDGELGANLRQAVSFSNPGESFPIERRLVMIGLYLADMSVSDNYWALSAWADSCMVPHRQARLMEREALILLRHSITISPKAWLDHCSHVYSNVARLRIGDANINWALLEVCHKMVTTARGIVSANEESDYQWTVTRKNLELQPGLDLIKSHRIDTSRMIDDSWLDNVSDNAEGEVSQLVDGDSSDSPIDSDQENKPPRVMQDDDDYEEFDGAAAFPQPVFKKGVLPPFHVAVQPPAKVQVVESNVSAPALQAALSLVAMNQAPDNDSDPAMDEDDDESDYEPYDGAGAFPMPIIQGKRVVSTRAPTTRHATSLQHPRAVPRSPVQLARVRPVLNRFETMAALLADAPYHFPTAHTVNQKTVLAALHDDSTASPLLSRNNKVTNTTVPVGGGQGFPHSTTTQVHFYPAVGTNKPLSAAIPQYPAQSVADQLSVPPNHVWPSTNPLNMTRAAQPHAIQPPMGRLSPVTAQPGDVFPADPIAPRQNSLLNRRYRHPGFFRERYVPPPTPVEQPQIFAPFSVWAPPEKLLPRLETTGAAAHNHLEPPPLTTNRLLSPSSDCASTAPNTPHEHVQLWRRNVTAVGCERPPSAMTCVSTSTCDQNAMYWHVRDVMDDALAQEGEGFLPAAPFELQPGTVMSLGA